ncbi:MAG TPA: chromate efflux transporter [Candidatus Dormibacteraeota bacterium]|nr:chromate efflux transporter [Candidatus Dormibacteraeota bacterium]
MPATTEIRAEAPGTANGRTLRELSLLYLRLGTTAFGGPAAHIAMMEDEVVRRRRWLTREEFLDLLGVINLIPGPNSTEMAIQIGYRIAGWPGLLLGGTCFILPAAVLTLALAWLYVHYGTLPQAASVLYGIKAVMIAIVLQAIWNLSRTAVKTKLLAFIGGLAVVMNALGVNVLLVLFGAGIATVVAKRMASSLKTMSSAAATLPVSGSISNTLVGALGTKVPFGLVALFAFFLKVGAVLFGSGYVLLAFLRTDLVVRLQWLTDKQLLDAVAVGQVTPGPVFTTATFIGYLLGRIPGALVATVGIFLPSFVFIAVIGPLVSRMRKSAVLGAFLDGVNVGALALMVVVTWHLGKAALIDWVTIALAAASAITLIRFRINSTWLILAGGIIGYVGQTALA